MENEIRHVGTQTGYIKKRERYYLDSDGDGHWFVIPVSKRKEWAKWCELDSEDEAAWTPPEFAKKVGGSYTLVTFESFKIE